MFQTLTAKFRYGLLCSYHTLNVNNPRYPSRSQLRTHLTHKGLKTMVRDSFGRRATCEELSVLSGKCRFAAAR